MSPTFMDRLDIIVFSGSRHLAWYCMAFQAYACDDKLRLQTSPGLCLPVWNSGFRIWDGRQGSLGLSDNICSIRTSAIVMLTIGSMMASWYRHQCNDAIMTAMASQITSLTIVSSTVYSGADQRKYQSSELLAFVWGIHRWPVNSPHKEPVTRKMFPSDDFIMTFCITGFEGIPSEKGQ